MAGHLKIFYSVRRLRNFSSVPAAGTLIDVIALNGFLVGLSLIVAIGPQNALLLRQGISRTGVGAVITVCLLSDVVLILGGTAGVGVLVESHPAVLTVLTYGGAAYLLYFAYTCFRDAFRPSSTGLAPAAEQDPGARIVSTSEPQASDLPGGSASARTTTATAVAERTHTAQSIRPERQRRHAWSSPVIAALLLTWLNPAAYIDALVMLGGIANQFGEQGRWEFALGALAASCVWFPALGYGARALAEPLSRPKNWQKVNLAVGITMVLITIRLLTH